MSTSRPRTKSWRGRPVSETIHGTKPAQAQSITIGLQNGIGDKLDECMTPMINDGENCDEISMDYKLFEVFQRMNAGADAVEETCTRLNIDPLTARSRRGWTIAQIAAEKGSTDVLQWLLVRLNSKKEKYTPEDLLCVFHSPDDGGRFPLSYAAMAGKVSTLQFLLTMSHVGQNIGQKDALVQAWERADARSFNLLLRTSYSDLVNTLNSPPQIPFPYDLLSFNKLGKHANRHLHSNIHHTMVVAATFFSMATVQGNRDLVIPPKIMNDVLQISTLLNDETSVKAIDVETDKQWRISVKQRGQFVEVFPHRSKAPKRIAKSISRVWMHIARPSKRSGKSLSNEKRVLNMNSFVVRVPITEIEWSFGEVSGDLKVSLRGGERAYYISQRFSSMAPFLIAIFEQRRAMIYESYEIRPLVIRMRCHLEQEMHELMKMNKRPRILSTPNQRQTPENIRAMFEQVAHIDKMQRRAGLLWNQVNATILQCREWFVVLSLQQRQVNSLMAQAATQSDALHNAQRYSTEWQRLQHEMDAVRSCGDQLQLDVDVARREWDQIQARFEVYSDNYISSRPPPKVPNVGQHSFLPTAPTDVDNFAISPRGALETSLCVVCLDGERNRLILPCRHLCLCEDCSNKQTWKECPLCNSSITAIIEVFVP